MSQFSYNPINCSTLQVSMELLDINVHFLFNCTTSAINSSRRRVDYVLALIGNAS
jgi:hypothetical protein